MKKLCRWSGVLREQYGERVQKVNLDTGAGCPHRIGLTMGGCIFCDERGGGDGAFLKGISIREQVRKGVEGARRHYKANSIILYFQSYSATFGPIETFKANLEEALDAARSFGATVRGISVSTRPDLLPQNVLAYLGSLLSDYEIWVEIGVQTIDPAGLAWLRRGHGLDDVENTLARLRMTQLKICTHLIAGIPGEKDDQLTHSALWLAERGVHAIKFHPLHVLRGTPLEELYRSGKFVPLTREEYVRRVVDALIALPDGIILQRLTAGARPAQLVAPRWLLEKESLEREITRRFNERVLS